MTHIVCERAYALSSADNCYRVLVDRLWPRGIKKENLPIDEWLKEVAPSTELRKWFNHDIAKWPEFQARFTKELDEHKAALSELLNRAGHKTLVLIFAAKDSEHNNAVVIKRYLEAL